MPRKFLLRYFLIGALALVSVIIIPSLSEFVIALMNRYSVYPAGQDTSMLANMTILQFFLSAAVAVMIVCGLRLSKDKKSIILPFLIIFLCAISLYIPSFLPADWCHYELRIYSCGLQPLY